MTPSPLTSANSLILLQVRTVHLHKSTYRWCIAAEGGLGYLFIYLDTVMLFKPLISTKDSWEKTLQIQLQCRAEILSNHWTKTAQHVSFLDTQYIVANKYKVNYLHKCAHIYNTHTATHSHYFPQKKIIIDFKCCTMTLSITCCPERQIVSQDSKVWTCFGDLGTRVSVSL